MNAPDTIRAALMEAARRLGAPVEEVVLERPKDTSHGDLATNLALALAKALKSKPRDVAQKLVDTLALPAGMVRKTEIAGPGFINFFLAEQALTPVIGLALTEGKRYGRSPGAGHPVNVEFVSANPTGPLHVGHGRQAALGDGIASLLEWTGWNVSREFYYNDAGGQIERLTQSVIARLEGREPADDGYHGAYIQEVADAYGSGPRTPDDVRRFAVDYLRREQDQDLQAFGVRFDTYFLESSLYTNHKVDETLKTLERAGHTYHEDGALWLKTTDFGDDKDRVLVRSAAKGGEPTYFVPDVAYHVDKWKRGFHRAINVQGADHHSTVTRVRIGLQALDMGIPQGYPEYVLHQMVTVVKGGEEMKVSKRAGSYVTLRDLLDEVGPDAMRYFFLMRKSDSHFVFDVDLAKRQTDENPVYYVQMAHARMSGIFRVAGRDPEAVAPDGVDLAVLTQPEEVEILKDLAEFPAVVQEAASALEPHRIPTYLEKLAGEAHGWYHKYRVLGEPEEAARLLLARAVRQVLANGLALVGIAAPDRM